VMPPFDLGNFDLTEWLRIHSHVSAITEKAHHKYVTPITRKIQNKYFKPQIYAGNYKMGYWPDPPQLYEAEKVVPDDEMTKIYDNFEADLRAIGRLADEKGKIVIISSVPSHEEYGPAFSVHKADLGDEELREFDEAYSRGLDRFNRGDFEGAVVSFLIAAEIDDQAALLNYMLGRSYLKMGDAARGRPHIQRSIDNDGLYNRASSTLARISESIAGEYASVHYVDTIQSFQQALDSGITNDELFSDFQHPSFMGRIVFGFPAPQLYGAITREGSFKWMNFSQEQRLDHVERMLNSVGFKPVEVPEASRNARTYERILQFLTSNGAEVCMVVMPLTQLLRSSMINVAEFQRAELFLESLAAEYGVRFVDMSDVITNAALFVDADHLNGDGAREFASLLEAACFGDSLAIP